MQLIDLVIRLFLYRQITSERPGSDDCIIDHDKGLLLQETQNYVNYLIWQLLTKCQTVAIVQLSYTMPKSKMYHIIVFMFSTRFTTAIKVV